MICPSCGSETDAGLRFCKSCGVEMKAQPPPPTGPPPPSQVSQPAAPQLPAGQAPSPPQQHPQQQAQGQVQGQQPTPVYLPQGAPGSGSPTIIGVLAFVAGEGIAVSTFLPWVSAGALGFWMQMTGWDFLKASRLGSSGNFLFTFDNGTVFFSGFWSLLLGALIILGAVLLLTGRRIGGMLTRIFGLLGTLIAATNIVMIYWKMGGVPHISVSPGIGLWLFLGLSVAALVLGLVGDRSSG